MNLDRSQIRNEKEEIRRIKIVPNKIPLLMLSHPLKEGGWGRWPTIIILFLTLLSTRWLPTKLGALKIYSFIHRPLITYFWGQNWKFSKADKYLVARKWPLMWQTITSSTRGSGHKAWPHQLQWSFLMSSHHHIVIVVNLLWQHYEIICNFRHIWYKVLQGVVYVQICHILDDINLLKTWHYVITYCLHPVS